MKLVPQIAGLKKDLAIFIKLSKIKKMSHNWGRGARGRASAHFRSSVKKVLSAPLLMRAIVILSKILSTFGSILSLSATSSSALHSSRHVWALFIFMGGCPTLETGVSVWLELAEPEVDSASCWIFFSSFRSWIVTFSSHSGRAMVARDRWLVSDQSRQNSSFSLSWSLTSFVLINY